MKRPKLTGIAAMYPGIDFIPHPDSPKWQGLRDDQKETYRAIRWTLCPYCNDFIGWTTWFFVVPSAGSVMHEFCRIKALEDEDREVSNPWSIERAAKANSMSIEEFKKCPLYARRRMILTLPKENEN